MADTSFEFANRKRPTWMNQYFATSGNVPSAQMLDEIIQSELAAAADKRAQSTALALQAERDAYAKLHDTDVLNYTKQHDTDVLGYNKEHDTSLLNYNKEKDTKLLDYNMNRDTLARSTAEDNAKRGTTNAWISGGTGLLGTAAGLWGKDVAKEITKPKGPTEEVLPTVGSKDPYMTLPKTNPWEPTVQNAPTQVAANEDSIYQSYTSPEEDWYTPTKNWWETEESMPW